MKNRMYIFTCYVCTKLFHEKPTCHLAYVKKKKFGAKNKTFYDIYFVFLHRSLEMPFFRRTLRTHMDYGDVHAKFFIQIF
jgi:hypothetical protein